MVKALIKGEKVAFQELYSRYSGLFFTITRRYAKTHQEAEDLLQESFVQIYRKVHTFKFNGSFEGWMKRVVVNKCLSFLKKKDMMTDMPEFEVDTGFGGSEAAIGISRLSVEEILMAFDGLPAGARTVLNLYAIDGFDHHEIASQLGITESASIIMVPPDAPGFSVAKIHDKLGRRLLRNAELVFDDCRVPVKNLVGEENHAWQIFHGFAPGINNTIACLVGGMRTFYEESLEFARKRVQGGVPIIKHTTIGSMLAEMRVKVEASRALLWKNVSQELLNL